MYQIFSIKNNKSNKDIPVHKLELSRAHSLAYEKLGTWWLYTLLISALMTLLRVSSSMHSL